MAPAAPNPVSSVTTATADAARLVADADQLEADGKLLEAVDVLTEANRRQRDAEIDRRLVRLRHRAFATIDRSGGLPSWPPEVPGDRPVDAGPLVVSADELSVETLRQGIFRHGSLHVRGLVSRERVDLLTGDIDRAFDGFQARADGAPASETTPWFERFKAPGGRAVGVRRQWTHDAGGVWAADSPRGLFDLVETLEHTGLGRLITGHLGERPAFSMNKCVLRRTSLDAKANWHQDGAFLGSDIRAVNVWMALTDCGRDAPGLDLVGRRLDGVVETGTEGAAFDWAVGPGVVDRVADGTVVRPLFNAGDVLLFDDLTLHRTALTPSMTRERHAIEMWFFAPSRYPDDQVPLAY